jgi:simple sugar transport system permease protein
MLTLFLMAGATGAAWTIVPAVLKARYGTNEIITTLMMSFIGVDLASLLIKGPFQDPAVSIRQTRVLDFDKMLPPIPGTRIHIGLLVAFGAIFVVYFLLTGRRGAPAADHGANPRAAKHFGVNLPRLIVTSFLASAS